MDTCCSFKSSSLKLVTNIKKKPAIKDQCPTSKCSLLKHFTKKDVLFNFENFSINFCPGLSDKTHINLTRLRPFRLTFLADFHLVLFNWK